MTGYDEPLIPLLLDTNLCDDSPEDGVTTGDAEVTLVLDSPIATDEMTPSDDWPCSVELLATIALLEDTLANDRIVDDTEDNKVVLSKIDELRLARLLETVDGDSNNDVMLLDKLLETITFDLTEGDVREMKYVEVEVAEVWNDSVFVGNGIIVLLVGVGFLDELSYWEEKFCVGNE